MTIVGFTVPPERWLGLGTGAALPSRGVRHLGASDCRGPAARRGDRPVPARCWAAGRPPGARRAAGPARLVYSRRPGHPDRPAQLRPGAGPAARYSGSSRCGRPADHHAPADDLGAAAAARLRDLAALGFTSWQVRGTLCWQAFTLAGIALLIGVPPGTACGGCAGRLRISARHHRGSSRAAAALSIMAAGSLAAAAVIAAPAGRHGDAKRPTERCTASSPPTSHDP